MKKIVVMLLTLTLYAGLCGCSALSSPIFTAAEHAANSKAVFTLDQTGTHLSCDGETWSILNERVSRSDLGGWRGIIRKFAIFDRDGTLVDQIDNELLKITVLPEQYAGDDYYSLSYFNVYQLGSDLAVDIGNHFYRVVKGRADPSSLFSPRSLSPLS